MYTIIWDKKSCVLTTISIKEKTFYPRDYLKFVGNGRGEKIPSKWNNFLVHLEERMADYGISLHSNGNRDVDGT